MKAELEVKRLQGLLMAKQAEMDQIQEELTEARRKTWTLIRRDQLLPILQKLRSGMEINLLSVNDYRQGWFQHIPYARLSQNGMRVVIIGDRFSGDETLYIEGLMYERVKSEWPELLA